MALNHGGDPIGSILGTNGVPLGPKNGSKAVKITMPQNSNFWLSIFRKKSKLRLWRQTTVGTP